MADQLFTDGKAYERLMGRWSRLAGAAFLDWLNVPKAMRWLDAGCGNGAFTEEIIARCAPAVVTAIDPSEEQPSICAQPTRYENRRISSRRCAEFAIWQRQ